MLLSVVIPVFNEQDTLFEIISRVLAVDLPLDRELVLIDDASTDRTHDLYPQLGDRFPDATIRLFKQPVNQGKGAAIRRGFIEAAGDIIVVQDADLEYSPTDYPRLLAPILAGHADVVYGSRYAHRDPRRVHAFWHTFMNQSLTRLSNMFTNLNLSDMETCYKMFRAEVIKGLKLRSNRFGIEPEMTAKIARGGWRVYEVAIEYAGRSYDEGKKITWRDGVRAIYCIIRFRLAD
jgi:glycosyltransferase involved in cell wall biosynthesis